MSEAKQPVSSAQTLPWLPPEVWENIFNRLTFSGLLQVRLVCRSWQHIVDGSSVLRDKILVRFSQGMDCSKVPEYLYHAPNALFWWAKIVAPPELWWPSFAASLSSLTLESTVVPFRTFFWMLRHALNLKRLTLDGLSHQKDEALPDEAVVEARDFRLEKMERFVLQRVDGVTLSEILTIFGDILPRLKHFELNHAEERSGGEIQSVVDFIRAVQNSLERIALCLWTDVGVIEAISKMDQLRLKRFSFTGKEDSKVVCDFLRTQPNLEDIVVLVEAGVSSEDLSNVGWNFSRLKRLTLNTTEDDLTVVPSFLATMKELQQFHFRTFSSEPIVDFNDLANPNLKRLKVQSMRLSPNSWQQYLLKSPNISTISLISCKFPSCSNLFASIGQLKLLRTLHLELITVDSDDGSDNFSNCFEKLQTLTLDSCKLSKKWLIALFQLCPMLEELKLHFIHDIDDEVFLVMCQQLNRLRRLTVCSCRPISEISARHIANYCKSLQILTVAFDQNSCEINSEDCVGIIQSETNIAVVYDWGYNAHDNWEDRWE